MSKKEKQTNLTCLSKFTPRKLVIKKIKPLNNQLNKIINFKEIFTYYLCYCF